MKTTKKTHGIDPENWTANYRELLLQIALHRVSDYQIAEDLVQDTFLAAWKARHRFRGECSEKTFLQGILKNKIIDFYRARGRKPTLLASQMDGDDGEETGWLENQSDQRRDLDPNLAALRADFLTDLEEAVGNLPDKMGRAFRLWMMNDLSTQEVTKMLNISDNNLWVTLHRAKKLLRAQLNGEWKGASLASS